MRVYFSDTNSMVIDQSRADKAISELKFKKKTSSEIISQPLITRNKWISATETIDSIKS